MVRIHLGQPFWKMNRTSAPGLFRKQIGPATAWGACPPSSASFGREYQQHVCLPVEQERAGAAPAASAIFQAREDEVVESRLSHRRGSRCKSGRGRKFPRARGRKLNPPALEAGETRSVTGVPDHFSAPVMFNSSSMPLFQSGRPGATPGWRTKFPPPWLEQIRHPSSKRDRCRCNSGRGFPFFMRRMPKPSRRLLANQFLPGASPGRRSISLRVM